MSTINSISSNPAVSTLVERALAQERKPLTEFEQQKSDLNKQLAIYTDLKSTLTELRDRAQKYTSLTDSPLSTQRSATSSNPSVFKVEADKSAQIGIHSLFVERLASRDVAISARFTAPETGTALADQFFGTTQTFSIAVGSGDAVELSIEFNDENETDESILKRIRDAINGIDLEVSSSYIKDTPTSARLTITSVETGGENAITVQSIGDSTLMQALGYLNGDGERKQYDGGTEGGFLQRDTQKLDALFTLDGISMVRGSNKISDLLEGVTITLAAAQKDGEAPETLTVERNVKDLKEELGRFIEDFNKAIKYINVKTKVDSVTYERGPLAGNFSVSNLRFQLRDAVSRSIAGVEPGAYRMLSSIGIDLDRDGVMSIKDEDKLTQALDSNPSEVIDIFASTNGVANKIESVLDRFVSTGGIIDNNKRGVNSRIDYLKTRIKGYEDRLAVRERVLRMEYTNLQKVLSSLNSQQSMLSQIYGGLSTFNMGYSF